MMNEQEMQFADPDWRPTGQLSAPQAQSGVNLPPVPVAGPVNSQIDELSQPASQSSYAQGYQGLRPATPLPPPPVQPFAQQIPYQANGQRARGRSYRWVWVLIVLISIPMLMSGIFRSTNRGGSAYHPDFHQPAQVQNQQVYTMQGATELDINDLSGNVTVQVSDTGDQSVTVTSADGSQPQVNYQGSQMVLTSSSDGDITILVPTSVMLKLSAGVGDLEVDDFSGQLTAQTNSGQIILNNDSLSSGSSLDTNSGNINLQSGSVTDSSITSLTGSIVLDQTNLGGQVTVSTGGNGSISYTGGTLDAHGKYQFTTDSGSIDLSLPQGTAMHMNISQKGGSFHSDFPGDTGGSPQASVGITTNSGDITISKQ